MRILHVLGKLDRGGAETWLVQTLRHIDRSKYQFDFLVHNDGPGAYDNEVRALGARIIPCLSPENPVKFGRNFLRVLKQYGPYDCVHSHVHHYSGYVLFLARLAGIPVRVAHSHTAHNELNVEWSRRVYLAAMKALIRKYSTKGIAVSSEAGASLFGSQPNGKWEVQPPGVDLNCFRKSVDRNSLRTSLNIAADAFVVGHVGRFVEAKNHQFIVYIAQELCTMRPKTVFLLIGDGPLKKNIEAQVRALNLESAFRFLGVRSDIAGLMKGAMDVFLFPSRFEGLGLALIEAQAAGLNSVVSEVIPTEVDAIAGAVQRLSLNSSPKSWADAVIEAGKKSRHDGGLSSALDSYDILKTSERLRSTYDSQTGALRAGAVYASERAQ